MFDTKCYDLAICFLEDYFDKVPVKAANDLAQIIQDTIEDFIEYDLAKERRERKP